MEALPSWLESAQASSVHELRQFAQGIERDRAAIEAALSRKDKQRANGRLCHPWYPLIKREMYSRAKFD